MQYENFPELKKIVETFEVDKFHSSRLGGSYLLKIKDKNYEINESFSNLIYSIKNSDSIKSTFETFSTVEKKKYSEKDFLKIIDKLIFSLWERSQTEQEHSFTFKYDILSYEKFKYLTKSLSFLFKTPLIIIILLCVIIAFSYVYLNFTGRYNLFGESIKIVLAIFLYVVSVVFHEIGHASACQFYNIRHGNLGIALYLFRPVFYIDVTNCWSLKRSQRIVVNIGGMYFQMIFCVLAYFLIL